MKNEKDLLAGLIGFYSTENHYKLSTRLLLTDGAKYLADNAECYWLFDIVASMASIMRNKGQEFILVKFRYINPFPDSKDKRCYVTFEDGNGNEFYKQKIEYSDFPLLSYEFYVILSGNENGNWFYVAMLKSEY